MTERTPFPKDFPPVLYLPCAEMVSDPADLRVEYRETRDGRLALLVYSALDRLHRACGDAQPWFVLPTINLDSLYDNQPFDLVLLDIRLPDDQRRTSEAG